ncbi:MAG TPA: DNA polymerase III subunit delta [Nitrospiraceae bacterium]|nr:DNA polymerase III subunit delta [Nitrospiraceae bacterium]
MIVKASTLAHYLEREPVPPLCLVEGEEEELRRTAVATLKDQLLGVGTDDVFNSAQFYADEDGASTILTATREIPVFAPRRVVVVKQADKITARDNEAWLAYLADPCETTALILVAEKLDKRLKWTQALVKRALVVDCSPLSGAALTEWIRSEAARLNLKLTEEGIGVLHESAGHSLAHIKRDLEKLALTTPDGTAAGAAEVEASRGIEPGASVFDLTTAIGARDCRRTLEILARSLEAGEAPLRILGALVWQYRRLWKMKDLLAQGGRDGEVARTLRVEPYRVKSLLGRFSEPHLRRAFELFVDTDSKLKGGSAGSSRRVMETLLLSLCQG